MIPTTFSPTTKIGRTNGIQNSKFLSNENAQIENKYLQKDNIYLGDSRNLLKQIEPDSIACSIWSPPYHTGKDYEKDMNFDDWQSLLREVIRLHFSILKPGGFLAINIADILCFKDENMPRIQAATTNRLQYSISRDEIIEYMKNNPSHNRDQIAEAFNCSEQTIDRRLNGNNIRGGKTNTQTRVKVVGGFIEEMGLQAGLFLYDRRVWTKDPSWANCKWHSLSYRSVDEFEYIYIFWKPGITRVDRKRLEPDEWSQWGSRGVWNFPSVKANDIHEAMFPVELPRRVIKLLSDPGEIVLDCFMGSGTTAIAALRENRHFIGIDKMKEYAELSKKNISREIMNQPLQFVFN